MLVLSKQMKLIINSLKHLSKESSDHMKIKLKTLSLITYDMNKKKHYHFVKDITSDQLMNKFIPEPIENQLIESTLDDKVEVGSSYIVGEDKNLIGYIRFNELDEFGVLTLHYGVGPDFRRKNYGTKILQEVSEYAFKNINEVEKVRLYINAINKGSIKCAENANFLKQENYLYENPVVYIKSRSTKNQLSQK